MDVVDYQIKGAEMQFVEVELRSLPFSRLASRIFASAPQNGGSADRAGTSSGAGGLSSRLNDD